MLGMAKTEASGVSGDSTGLTPPNLTMEEYDRLEDYKPFGAEHEGAVSQRSSVVARASDIKPKKVHWLWQERLPRGKCVLVAGEGGLGKSMALAGLPRV
jgi:AAA domain-containing protein